MGGAFPNDGETVAEAFYQANKDEMERGAVTWAARGVLALMKIRARDGHATFDSEYQNDPVAGDAAPFANSLNFWLTVILMDFLWRVRPEFGQGRQQP